MTILALHELSHLSRIGRVWHDEERSELSFWRLLVHEQLERMEEQSRSERFSHVFVGKPSSRAKRHRAIARVWPQKESQEITKIKDDAARMSLAKILGLKKPPKRDWSAFEEIRGVLDDVFRYEREKDSVAIVRRIRRG